MEAGDGRHDDGRRVDLRTPGILETVIAQGPLAGSGRRELCRGGEAQAQVEERV